LFIEYSPEGEIAFLNLRKLKRISKPSGPVGAIEPVPAPDELVGWFQHHPYLRTTEPEPATVGGIKGEQFDVVANLPKNHTGLCGTTCVDIFALRTGILRKHSIQRLTSSCPLPKRYWRASSGRASELA